MYEIYGTFYNSATSGHTGTGTALVQFFPEHYVKIDFHIKLNNSGSGDNFAYGINRDIINTMLGGAEQAITPSSGGAITIYRNGDSALIDDINGLGATMSANGQFWNIARIYSNGSYAIGSWPEKQMLSGFRIVGNCYGLY